MNNDTVDTLQRAISRAEGEIAQQERDKSRPDTFLAVQGELLALLASVQPELRGASVLRPKIAPVVNRISSLCDNTWSRQYTSQDLIAQVRIACGELRMLLHTIPGALAEMKEKISRLEPVFDSAGNVWGARELQVQIMSARRLGPQIEETFARLGELVTLLEKAPKRTVITIPRAFPKTSSGAGSPAHHVTDSDVA